MQKLATRTWKQSSRMLRRFMSTEVKSATEAPTVASAKVTQKVTQGASSAPKVPKMPNNPKKSRKVIKVLFGTTTAVLGVGGIYRYHTGTDHLACIGGAKGGNDSNILETLYLVPKNLESKYDNFKFNTYVDRLINEIVHNNPRGFKTMEDVLHFFSQWFITIGIEVDLKAPVTEDSLFEMFSEFSKQENMFNVFIIGERHFGVSPTTDFMANASARFFDCQRRKSKGKYYVPTEVIIELIEALQERTKETYYVSGFVPNFVNKILSSEARAVNTTKLVNYLRNRTGMKIGIYEFANLMASVERQTKAKRFYYNVNDYVELKVNESLFDNHDGEEEDIVVVEATAGAEAGEEAEVEVEIEIVEAPIDGVIPMEEKKKIVEQPTIVTLDSLLSDLEVVRGERWTKLITADLEGVKGKINEEREIRKELKRMNWW